MCACARRGAPKDANGDGRGHREAWFAQALDELARQPAIAQRHQSIAFPAEIGCGLAGGDWAAYHAMLERFARGNPQVRVVIVRYDGGSGGGGGGTGKRARASR